jgi:hypothetical protein
MDNRLLLNRVLGKVGLSTLDDPTGIAQQLGFLVEDDKHFKQLLNRCEPQYRREMYEALRPHLGFEARALDVYIAELGMEAEIAKLPVVTGDGKLRAHHTQDIRTISRVIEETISKRHLVMTCRACTREEAFHGGVREEVIRKAREAGWTYGVDDAGEGYEICPECEAAKTN